MESQQRLQSVCLLILTFIATGVALAFLKPVMVPFILALFLGLILTTIINVQKKYLKFNHPTAVVTSILLAGVILFLIGLLISASVSQMIANADSYQAKIMQLAEKVTSSQYFERHGSNIKSIIEPSVRNMAQRAGNMVLGTFNAIIGIFSQGILVLIFVLFLLLGGKKATEEPDENWVGVELRIKKYIVTKLLISGVTGILVGIVLTILNIDLALAFGLMAFILNFIPSIGSLIATLLPLPVVLISPDVTTATAIMAIAIPGVIQFTIGNVIEPQVMGDSIGLNPITILLSLIFWGIIWGIVGMFLAVPLAVVLKVIMGNIEYTEKLAGKM